MHKTILTLTALVLVAYAATPSVANTFYYQSGNQCRKTSGAAYGTEQHDTGGTVFNGHTTTPLHLSCPVSQLESSTQNIESFRLYYWEDNTGTDVLDDFFYCRLTLGTDSNTEYNSSYRYTCNTAGGCASANSTDNPGDGYLSWGNDFSSTAGLLHIGFSCQLCEASPGSCLVRGYRVELVGS